MSLSVCIDALYYGKKIPVETQIKEVAKAGYDTIEFWAWWDKDMEALKRACDIQQVRISTFCTKFVSLIDPRFRKEYRKDLEDSIRIAKKLGVNKLITQTGSRLPDISFQDQKERLIEGLQAIAPVLENAGIQLLVEPLNVRVDHAGYFLVSSDDAFDIINTVGSDAVKVLFDVYHQQISEGDVSRRINAHVQDIGHFHLADNPGRGRPGTGELNYRYICSLISERAPRCDMGLEYFTDEDIPSSLSTLRSYLAG